MESKILLEVIRETKEKVPQYVPPVILQALGLKEEEISQEKTQIKDESNYEYVKFIYKATIEEYSANTNND
jgi:hypothetical protein